MPKAYQKLAKKLNSLATIVIERPFKCHKLFAKSRIGHEIVSTV